MKLLCTVFLALMSFSTMAQSQYLKVAGNWEGSISVEEASFKVVFHIKYENEILSATMDNPDQNAYGLKVDEISFSEGVLKMKSNQAQTSYEGTLNHNIVEGKLSQAGQTYDMKLVKKVKRRSS